MRNRLLLLALFATAAPVAVLAEEAPKPAPQSTDVAGVVVQAQKPAISTSIDRRSYSVSGDLQAQSGSIADALRNLPSVEVDVQGNVSLRGDSNVTILIDGKPSTQFQGDNKGQALQQLPAGQIERVEVITNPSAEFSPDGSAGVINLITKKAQGMGATGSARISASDAGRLILGGNVGFNGDRLSFTGDAAYRRDRQLLWLHEERQRLVPGGFDDTTQDQVSRFKPQNLSGRAGLDYDLDARTRLGLQARLSLTDFRLQSEADWAGADPTGLPVSQFVRILNVHQQRVNGQLGASLRRKLDDEGGLFTLNFTYDATNDDRVRGGQTRYQLPAGPDAFDQQRIDNLFTQLDLKGDLVRPLGDGVTLKLGFDIQRDDNDYVNRGFKGAAPGALTPDLTLTNHYRFRQTLSQAYATYERPVGPLTVLAGLRLERTQLDLAQITQGRFDSRSDLKAYPTLHLAWKLDDSRTVTASYSRRIQRPNPFDYNSFRFMVDPVNYRSGNPNLRPQQTDSFELGYELRRGPSRYLATLFYRENQGGVADVAASLGGGVFLATRQNLADSRSLGVELVATGRFSPSLTYNLSSTVARIELDSFGPGFPPTRSIWAVSGRGNLNWQASPDDLVQLNVFAQGKRLTSQGLGEPMAGVNLGYRRRLTDQLAFVLTAQDLFGTFGDRLTLGTPILKDRVRTRFDTRQVMIGLSWTFAGGKPREPNFDYGGGITPPTQ
ncbi:outer membrane receptor protein involved in Fe transport [Caulobacter ginsengisoli]|uniref:Outer membrane receptor protein involved in Fe transport n=1 Tax=Caulobacter ginsengisoli TaxID=400775 RepID=A0ABU0ITI3_9CAUL|nr:outer membrane beta-barrel family protein [Caulobacter ginsengisoli]MDQ0465310.1 outer membrane receptor protein involved in Fe transport [Caulobacter ginsengisoli]